MGILKASHHVARNQARAKKTKKETDQRNTGLKENNEGNNWDNLGH